MNSFDELNLSAPLAKALTEMGFQTPTPIQAATLPLLLKQPTDFMGMAATGTGKTAAFGIPLLESVEGTELATQALVLCPTRELAVQVAEQLTLLGKYKGIHVLAIYGGAGYRDQMVGLRRGAQIIVATPGRLVDHINRGNLSLESVRTIVLDEADEMISMGFKEELEFVLKQFSTDTSHRWFFAATMSPSLKAVADTYLRNPESAQVNQKDKLPGTVRQFYYTVREKNKAKGVLKLIDYADDFYGLIFCQTKVTVTGLTDFLKARGYKAECLHGDKSQMERERVLKSFKDKTIRIVVCSDVAARGLDVKDLTHVINYSLPHDFDSYIHRIGRTGRSGNTGLAMNLVAPSQMHMVDRLQRVTRTTMEAAIFPTRKDISAKKLGRLLPKFQEVPNHQKATEILGEDWKNVLGAMEKEEVVSRFLSLLYPELFEDTEKAEEIGFGGEAENERPARRHRPSEGRPQRSSGHGRREWQPKFQRRGPKPRRWEEGDAPEFSSGERGERGDRPERSERPEGRGFPRRRGPFGGGGPHRTRPFGFQKREERPGSGPRPWKNKKPKHTPAPKAE